jgi:histone-lysine N-methyltransferase SETMAR
MLKEAYEEEVLPISTAYRWFKKFSEGREAFLKIGGPGAPRKKTSQTFVNAASVIIREDARITIRKLAFHLGTSFGSAYNIVTKELGLRRICSRWIPRVLTTEQKSSRVENCKLLQNNVLTYGNGYLNKIITADESWIHHFEPEGKVATSQWHSPGEPKPKKARMAISAGKVMIITFFDIRGMVYQHVVQKGQTVNACYYIKVLERLCEHIRRKRPELREGGWLLHHDNARPHVARIVRDFLESHGIETVPHPPYSPDLAPCDFYLFPNLKKALKGKKFTTDEALVKAAEAILKRLSQNGFQHVFESWQKRWDRCIVARGEYFE